MADEVEEGPTQEELEWNEFIPESEPEYLTLAEAVDGIQNSVETIYKRGLMTPELRGDLIKLAQAVLRRLESQEW